MRLWKKERGDGERELIGSEYLNWRAQFLFWDPELIT